jgi:1-phosphofructokinase
MIYTLTTNPAIDLNIESDKINPSIVNRTKSTKYSENGKGINVSKILKHYGIDSKVLGFFGGFSGKFIISQLNDQEIENDPVMVKEPTRINIFINDGKNEYKIVNKGSFVGKGKQKELYKKLENMNDCDYLVISGSLPNGIKKDIYYKILDICNKKSIKVIMDISSKTLKDLLSYKPLLIKPNDEEINKIFGFKTESREEIINALEKIHKLGAQNILLTMGEKGLYFYNGDKILFCDTPRINLRSSACSGDASLGAFLSEWLFKNDLNLALKKSSAVGANVAESEGLGELKKVNNYINEVKIEEVK